MSQHKIEVFRTGIHTAMNGDTIEYSQADIESMAAMYNEQTERKAPLVIGHPKVDDPAYGWVESLAVEGDRMFATISNVSEKVVEAVKAGMFKMVSIALWPDKLLRHVGLLGATPPAVAGLAPVQFAADDNDFLEYAWVTSEGRMPTVGALFRSLRDFFIEQFGKEKTDSVLNSEAISVLHNRPQDFYINTESDGSLAAYSAKNQKEENDIMDETRLKEIEGKYKEMEVKFAAISAKNTELEGEIAASKVAIAEAGKKSAADIAMAEFGSMLTGLVLEGRVLPAEKDSIVAEFSDMYRANSVIQYAAGEVSLLEKFTARLKGRPVVVAARSAMFASYGTAAPSQRIDASKLAVEFSAVAGLVDAASIDLDTQIEAYATANKVSYEVAATRFGASS